MKRGGQLSGLIFPVEWYCLSDYNRRCVEGGRTKCRDVQCGKGFGKGYHMMTCLQKE